MDIRMTQRYAHHCTDSLRSGIEALENSSHDLVTAEENSKVSTT